MLFSQGVLGTNILQRLVGCELITLLVDVTKHHVKSHLEAQEFIWHTALTAHYGRQGAEGQSIPLHRQAGSREQTGSHPPLQQGSGF